MHYDRFSKKSCLKKNIIGLVIFAILVMSLPAYSQGSRGSVSYLAENGSIVYGARCGVVDRSLPADVLIRMEDINRLARENQIPSSLSIPVTFHVIYSSSGEGNVPDSQLQAQIDVLNLAYAGVEFSFFLASVDRTQNDWWYSYASNIQTEINMKKALSIDPAYTLNIYTCKPSNGVLGWTYLPWDFPETSFMHGLTILYSTLPGGTAAPYNEGDTAVHETGHYFGLFHTFQNGCRRPGDYMPDTPYEQTPAYYCQEGRDTCISRPGLDPIHNYMDYTEDTCMDEFTPNQCTYMRWVVDRFRPALMWTE